MDESWTIGLSTSNTAGFLNPCWGQEWTRWVSLGRLCGNAYHHGHPVAVCRMEDHDGANSREKTMDKGKL